MNQIKQGFILALIVFSGISFAASRPGGGSEVGHGGDPIEIDFFTRGYFIGTLLTESAANKSVLNSAERVKFISTLQSTLVQVVDYELKDSFGKIVTARTIDSEKSPSGKLIEVNRSLYIQGIKDGLEMTRLVFHEFLWSSLIDDTNYQVSNKLLYNESQYEIYKKGFKAPNFKVISDPEYNGLKFLALTGEEVSIGKFSENVKILGERSSATCRFYGYKSARSAQTLSCKSPTTELNVMQGDAFLSSAQFGPYESAQPKYISVLECYELGR